jgi:aminoglycoside 3-N-acetyltransferase
MFNLSEPSQPTTNDWAFIDELKSELHRKPHWNRKTSYPGELDLTKGVRILKDYPDPEGLLDTAWQDLERFLKDMSIPVCQADQGIEIGAIAEEQDGYESYCIEIIQGNIRIKSGDIEGIRRGIFYLEDMILGSDGPFLAPATIMRKPWIKNRISRCFFGPIKRPPFNRDELMDEVDYYPDEYLNRLAHEGINILWLTVEFRDLCKSELVPEYGKDRKKRLSKLRRTVDKCRRYGIKIFIFCIEPKIWGPEDPLLLNNPEVAGAKTGSDICFCPFSETSQKYLYDVVKSIFLDVPKLGGIISITHGERTTSCLSSVSATSEAEVNCPRCSKKEKGEILEATHIPIIQAMREVNPDAQFISWLYMPQVIPTAQWKYTIPEKLPKDTVLVFNFESGGEKEQLGKIRIGADYWQSYVGPSHRFVGMAKASQKAGIEMGAKIQVGCSHEVATAPFVPVPSMLWKKYRAMYDLNVTSVIQSWYFGNYPGIMNKAAGELAFESWGDFNNHKEQSQIEYDFLYRIAKADWGKHAEQVVRAWQYFYDGYSNYPMDAAFQYYGPMHDGVVWPLHLFPVHTPLAPTWKLDFPTSGDSIGECMISFTIKEAIALCEEMVKYWKKGVDILKAISPEFVDNPERLKDIGVAEALGIQFESGLNILKFYDLREQILWNNPFDQAFNKPNEPRKSELNKATLNQTDSNNVFNMFNQSKCLDEMELIVRNEINRSLRMVELCRFDSRLGFHSEAEGYKYFPEKLFWRVKQLEDLLKNDFQRMREILQYDRDAGNSNKHEYEETTKGAAKNKESKTIKQRKDLVRLTIPFNAPVYNCSNLIPAKAKTFEWTANVKNKVLFINVICHEIINNEIINDDNDNNDSGNDIGDVINNTIEDQLFLHIKAGDLGYPYNFAINLKTARDIYASSEQDIPRKSYSDVYIGFPIDCFYKVRCQGSNLVAEFELNLEKMPGYRGQLVLAISIVRNIKTDKEEIQDSWSGGNPHIRHRLCLSNYNPETMGRLELTRVPIIVQAEIETALKELGITEGDIVLVHSSLSSLGYVVNGAQAVIDAFESVIGKEGTLVFPTLTQKDFSRSYEIWHLDKPSDVGYLTEYFRKLPNVLRSDQATHSVAARGKHAYELTYEHSAPKGLRYGIFGETPFSKVSPWQKLYDKGGKVVFLGVTMRVNTFKHFMEYRVVNETLEKIKDDEAQNRLKEKIWHFSHFDNREGRVWPFHNAEQLQRALEKAGLVKKSVCGKAELICVNIRDMVDNGMKWFTEEPEAWYTPEVIAWLKEAEAYADK